MTIQEGSSLPEATLHVMQEGKPTAMSVGDLLGGKKVVLFAVPGAFTPTCSNAHLPGYVVKAYELKAKVFEELDDDDSEMLKYLSHELKTRIKVVQLLGENRWRLSDTDFRYLKTEEGMKEVSEYADGIGPWMNQLVTGVDFSGKAQITDLLKNARNNELLIHPYTFRADRLASYTSSFDELLDLFFQEVGVDGIFTERPDQAVRYLEKYSSN